MGGFWNSREVKRVSVSGGTPQTVYTLQTAQLNGPNGVSWGDNGVIYVAADVMRIVGVPAGGGASASIIAGLRGKTAFGIEELHALPGGRGLLYARFRTDNTTATIVLRRFGAGPDIDLVEGGTPRYLGSGHLLFARGARQYRRRLCCGAPGRALQGFVQPQGENHTSYDVFPDGSFLFIDLPRSAATNAVPPSFIAVFNWFEELTAALRR